MYLQIWYDVYTCMCNVHCTLHYLWCRMMLSAPQLLEAAQIAHETGSKDTTVAEILTERFTLKYRHIQINRPGLFLTQ